MITASFKVVEVGKQSRDRYYHDLDELLEDFPLEYDEIARLYEGKDLEKSWAKRRWLITMDEPEE